MSHIVYLTYYKGDKLPKWYIGSSSEEKIKNGYNGSIKSKKFKDIYKSEQTNNKHLFKTRILSCHCTRKEALTEELRLQQLHKVVKNELYMNESYATINGFFGRDVAGSNNPMYGKIVSKETKLKIGATNKNKKWSEEQKSNQSERLKGRIFSDAHKEKLRISNIGRKHSEETKLKISKINKGKTITEEHKLIISKANKGKIISDVHKEKISQALKGCKNHAAKIINIFDSSDNLIFRCVGNFKETCKLNGLPLNALKMSYSSNGSKIYNSKQGVNYANENNLEQYINWYAINEGKLNENCL